MTHGIESFVGIQSKKSNGCFLGGGKKKRNPFARSQVTQVHYPISLSFEIEKESSNSYQASILHSEFHI
jgi:hypothetical protein